MRHVGSASIGDAKENPGVYPLEGNVYTQEANRDDTYPGRFDVTFKPTCSPPRPVLAYVVLDPAEPAEAKRGRHCGFRSKARMTVGGEVSKRGRSWSVRRRELPAGHPDQPRTPTSARRCNVSAGEGATATFGAVDVIGTK